MVQLAVIKKGTQTADPTFDLCENTIIQGVIQTLSIVTACWGQLKPFLSWMRSNGLKLASADDTSAWAYKMSNLSQTRPSPQTQARATRATGTAFSLSTRHDEILVMQEWEVHSQSSQANIITGGRMETPTSHPPCRTCAIDSTCTCQYARVPEEEAQGELSSSPQRASGGPSCRAS